MWTVRTERLADARCLQLTFDIHAQQATYNEVILAWQTDAGFRSLCNSTLATVPFSAFRWETPAVTLQTLHQPFVCVVLDSPGLARQPEPEAFAEHFSTAENDVATFSNLGCDAILIVPCPLVQASAYGHLAAFVRLAPPPQQHALWQAVAEAMLARVSEIPVWLSTAGAGVSWLHVRLDDRPKYYGYGPFKSDN